MLKKRYLVIFPIMLCLILLISNSVKATDSIQATATDFEVKVNGDEIDNLNCPILRINGHMYAPLFSLSKSLSVYNVCGCAFSDENYHYVNLSQQLAQVTTLKDFPDFYFDPKILLDFNVEKMRLADIKKEDIDDNWRGPMKVESYFGKHHISNTSVNNYEYKVDNGMLYGSNIFNHKVLTFESKSETYDILDLGCAGFFSINEKIYAVAGARKTNKDISGIYEIKKVNKKWTAIQLADLKETPKVACQDNDTIYVVTGSKILSYKDGKICTIIENEFFNNINMNNVLVENNQIFIGSYNGVYCYNMSTKQEYWCSIIDKFRDIKPRNIKNELTVAQPEKTSDCSAIILNVLTYRDGKPIEFKNPLVMQTVNTRYTNNVNEVYAPVREFAEMFRCDVKYNEKERCVEISMKEQAPTTLPEFPDFIFSSDIVATKYIKMTQVTPNGEESCDNIFNVTKENNKVKVDYVDDILKVPEFYIGNGTITTDNNKTIGNVYGYVEFRSYKEEYEILNKICHGLFTLNKKHYAIVLDERIEKRDCDVYFTESSDTGSIYELKEVNGRWTAVKQVTLNEEPWTCCVNGDTAYIISESNIWEFDGGKTVKKLVNKNRFLSYPYSATVVNNQLYVGAQYGIYSYDLNSKQEIFYEFTPRCFNYR